MDVQADRAILDDYAGITRLFGYRVSFFKGSERVQEIKYCANRMDNHLLLEIHVSKVYYRNALRCKVTKNEAPEVIGVEDVDTRGTNKARQRLYAKAEGLLRSNRHKMTIENKVANPPRFD